MYGWRFGAPVKAGRSSLRSPMLLKVCQFALPWVLKYFSQVEIEREETHVSGHV